MHHNYKRSNYFAGTQEGSQNVKAYRNRHPEKLLLPIIVLWNKKIQKYGIGENSVYFMIGSMAIRDLRGTHLPTISFCCNL